MECGIELGLMIKVLNKKKILLTFYEKNMQSAILTFLLLEKKSTWYKWYKWFSLKSFTNMLFSKNYDVTKNYIFF